MNEQLSKRTAEADKRVGACVRAARIKAGYSQSKLAGELGITFQQLQKYEKGKNRVAVSTLLLIAESLSLPVQNFFESVERQVSDASDWQDLLTKDNIRLIKAYANIGDTEVKRRILNLILTVTDGAADLVFLDDAATTLVPAYASDGASMPGPATSDPQHGSPPS